MKYFKFYIFFFVVMMSFQSCKKFLDKKNDDKLVVPTTLADLQALLDHEDVMNMNTPALTEESSDDFFVSDQVFNSFPVASQQPYIWGEYIYEWGGDWSLCYVPVYNSNLVLERLDKIEKNKNNTVAWNTVKGSALFFRAYYFLHLAWAFSKTYDENTANQDLGIVLRLGSDANVPSMRASVQATYAQIIKDLEEAAQYLPDLPLNPMRPSKCASYALLARTYLSMRNYAEAYRYADLSLKIKSDLLNYNSTEIVSGNTPFKAYPYNKEVVFFSKMSLNGAYKSPTRALIDTPLYASYLMADKRKSIFFRPNGAYQRFKGSYSSGTTDLFTGIATDEIYLIRAEGHARAGRISEAMSDLNTLLQNRFTTGQFVAFSASSEVQALTLILVERRKELLMRGLRWMDLKRLNKEGANIVLRRFIVNKSYTLPPNDNRYALPLPNDIIQLTGMPQNPR